MKEKLYNITNKLLTVLLILSIIFFIISKVFGFSRVSGSSMYPTYEDKEFIICNRFLNTKDYNRGDVVIFYSGTKYISDVYIKRIVAIPGDELYITNGYLYVNGEKQETVLPLMKSSGNAHEIIKLQEDEFFVLGDNRNNSKDSRIIGPVKSDKIIGRVIHQREPKKI